ncbi:MAG: DUF935 family protein [Thermodesulfobacteriota bacterium]
MPVRDLTSEIAVITKDLDIFQGWLKRLENPDPVLRTEAAGLGLKLYDEVARDPHASSVLQQRILAVVGKEWEIIPASSPRASRGRPSSLTQEQKIADFVAGALEACNFDQARAELLESLLYGYYVVEVLWQVQDGALTVQKLIGKHPRRFIFTPERELRLLTPASLIEGEALPERKFVVMTYGDSDNPYGRGLGQKLWWPVWFKKNGIKFWLVFLEKFGMPTVKGAYPSGAPPEQQQALMDAIDAIQNETGIKIPDTMSIEFLEASRTGTVSHEKLCDYMDRQASKAVLGQTLTTEIKGEGSYAASETHNDVRQEIVEADADLLDACLNQTLIRWLVDLNFPEVTGYPTIVTHAGVKPDLKAQSEIDCALVRDIHLPVGRAYFYQTYGLPEPEDGEPLVALPLSLGEGRGEGLAGNFAESSPSIPLTPDQAALETLKTSAIDGVGLDPFLEPLLEIVRQASSLEEAKARIMDAYGLMDDAALTERLAQALFMADAWGRINAGT